ncbi:MAG: polyphenol oxidase family protein [Patescibacteria group bacterium]|nr:polyphenol oxidase family protein [Patescibacteria group bacterium]
MTFLLKTSTVGDGNMSRVLGPEAEALTNRRKFLEKNGFQPEYAYAELEHGDVIAVVTDTEKGKSVTADALVTNASGVPLMLITADCFPLAYYDPVAGVIALAHLGWKSSDLGLAGKVVREMQKLGAKPENVRVFIGPGIHKESYLVENPSQKEKSEWQPFLENAEGGLTRIDLIGFNKQTLMNAGVREEYIDMSPVDTAVSPEYFSHRRSAESRAAEGRFATVVSL